MVPLSSLAQAPGRRSTAARGLADAVPWIAVLSPAVALLLYLSPTATRWAEYDRASIAAGEIWRWASCHWTHWNAEHLLLDAVVFGVLAAACARRSPGRLAAALALAILAIPASIALAHPEMTHYRGLSGLDAALFALLAALELRESLTRGLKLRTWVTGSALVALAAKVLYELVTGDALFLDQAAAGFVPVPLAHAVGGAAGVLAALGGSKEPP